MQEAKVRALFELANIRVTGIQQIENQYWPVHPDYEDVRHESPWWLINTPAGAVKIGWRKRVISIDWSKTIIRKVITEDDVTKDEVCVHAWSYAKALEYLTELKRQMELALLAKGRAAQSA